MSIVVLEAGITGTPVLITDQCGFNEVGRTGGGMVVVPASVEGLEKGLVDMLNDRVKLKVNGQNLKTFVSKHFLWDSIIDEYLQLYKGLSWSDRRSSLASNH